MTANDNVTALSYAYQEGYEQGRADERAELLNQLGHVVRILHRAINITNTMRGPKK